MASAWQADSNVCELLTSEIFYAWCFTVRVQMFYKNTGLPSISSKTPSPSSPKWTPAGKARPIRSNRNQTAALQG